jgi:polar amino acid transport system substrate-binding protein
MDRGVAFRHVVLPQALRVALPGMTYNILAATTTRFLELGVVAALLYFGMSYPLSLAARRLEARMGRGRR